MKTQFLLAACAALSVGAAEICQQLDAPGSWAIPQYAKVGDESLILPGVPQTGAESFTVSAGKTYTLSGEFRALDGAADNSKLLIGFLPKTADGVTISYASVSPVSLQLGEVAETAAAGNSEVRVKGISKWKVDQSFYRIAFYAKSDKSDLPNRELSPVLLPGALTPDANGIYTLKMKAPLAKEYPAGTRIRLHASGDAYLFVGLKTNPSKLTGQWQRFSGKISLSGGNGCAKWYPGTAEAVVAILPLNVGHIEVRDLQVTEE